jgi:hypothetical protein
MEYVMTKSEWCKLLYNNGPALALIFERQKTDAFRDNMAKFFASRK